MDFKRRQNLSLNGRQILSCNLNEKLIYIKSYEVDFFGKDKVEHLSGGFVNYGGSATAPIPPVIAGYEFKEWDSDFSYITSDSEIVALYEEAYGGEHTVTFYNRNTPEYGIFALSVVQHGDLIASPGNPPPYDPPFEDKYKFVGWAYNFEEPVTADLSIYPDFREVLDLSYRYSDSYDFLTSYHHYFGEIISYEVKPEWKRDKRTLFYNITTADLNPHIDFSKEESGGLSTSQVVTLREQNNNIEIELNPQSIDYDMQEHEIPISAYLVPDSRTPINMTYRLDGGGWTSTIPKVKEKGSYHIEAIGRANDYYNNRFDGVFTIADRICQVTFNYNKYNEDLRIPELCSETFNVAAYSSVNIPSRISADDGYFHFERFDSDKYLNVTADCEISAIKTVKTYTAYFKHDNGKLIDIGQTYYHGFIRRPIDDQVYIDEFTRNNYVFKKWTNANSGWPRPEDKGYEDVDIDGKTYYAEMYRLVSTKVYKSINSQQTLLSTLPKKEEHTIILSSSLSSILPEVEYQEFSGQWNPIPIDGGWSVSPELTAINAIYKYTSGTLTYNSNFPNQYSVLFQDKDGKDYRLCVVNYHDSIDLECPKVDGLFSTGWSPKPINIENDMTCVATYIRKPYLIYKRISDPETALYSQIQTPYTMITKESCIDIHETKRPYYTPDYQNFYDIHNKVIDFPFEIISNDVTLYIKETENVFYPEILRSHQYDGEEYGLSVLSANPAVPCDNITIKYSDDTTPQIWKDEPTKINEIGSLYQYYLISAEDFRTNSGREQFTIFDSNKYEVTYYYQNANAEWKLPHIIGQLEHGADGRWYPDITSTISSTFIGWDREDEISSVKEDITTYAQYEVKNFEIKYYQDQYYKNPYEFVDSEIVSCYGDAKYEPTSKVLRDRWLFRHWGDKGGIRIELSNIQNNISAYAYLEKQVDLSLYVNCEGHQQTIKCATYISGDVILSSTIIENYVPEIEDHKFMDLSPKQGEYILNDDTIITANYSGEFGTVTYDTSYNWFTINVVANGNGFVKMNGSEQQITITKEVKQGQFCYIEAIPLDGYEFDQWTDGNKDQVRQFSASRNWTYTAKFKVKEYSITYLLDGGENDPDNPSVYTIESNTITFKKPTKEGYENGCFDPPSIPKGSTGDVLVKASYS